MSERHQRQRVIRALKSLDALSVENPANPGTPDVAYIGGWLELKSLREWPKRDESPLRIEHFTQQQRAWLRRHWLRGGNAFLLLQVANEWLLFDGDVAAEHVGLVNRSTLYSLAHRVWPEGLRDAELREMLQDMPRRESVYG